MENCTQRSSGHQERTSTSTIPGRGAGDHLRTRRDRLARPGWVAGGRGRATPALRAGADRSQQRAPQAPQRSPVCDRSPGGSTRPAAEHRAATGKRSSGCGGEAWGGVPRAVEERRRGGPDACRGHRCRADPPREPPRRHGQRVADCQCGRPRVDWRDNRIGPKAPTASLKHEREGAVLHETNRHRSMTAEATVPDAAIPLRPPKSVRCPSCERHFQRDLGILGTHGPFALQFKCRFCRTWSLIAGRIFLPQHLQILPVTRLLGRDLGSTRATLQQMDGLHEEEIHGIVAAARLWATL